MSSAGQSSRTTLKTSQGARWPQFSAPARQVWVPRDSGASNKTAADRYKDKCTMTTPNSNPQLNGIDLTDLQSALDEIAQQPEARHAGKRSRIQWLGGFRFNSFVRNNTFVVEEPASTTAADNAPNAMEYVLGALGACLSTGFVLNATRQGITIINLEVALDSTQDNVFTFFGLSDEGHPGFHGGPRQALRPSRRRGSHPPEDMGAVRSHLPRRQLPSPQRHHHPRNLGPRMTHIALVIPASHPRHSCGGRNPRTQTRNTNHSPPNPNYPPSPP